MAVLLKMLLKSVATYKCLNMGPNIETRRRDRSLTEVVLPVLGLTQLSRKSLEALLARLEEADALHVRHTVPLTVVNLVCEVHLV